MFFLVLVGIIVWTLVVARSFFIVCLGISGKIRFESISWYFRSMAWIT